MGFFAAIGGFFAKAATFVVSAAKTVWGAVTSFGGKIFGGIKSLGTAAIAGATGIGAKVVSGAKAVASTGAGLGAKILGGIKSAGSAILGAAGKVDSFIGGLGWIGKLIKVASVVATGVCTFKAIKDAKEGITRAENNSQFMSMRNVDKERAIRSNPEFEDKYQKSVKKTAEKIYAKASKKYVNDNIKSDEDIKELFSSLKKDTKAIKNGFEVNRWAFEDEDSHGFDSDTRKKFASMSTEELCMTFGHCGC